MARQPRDDSPVDAESGEPLVQTTIRIPKSLSERLKREAALRVLGHRKLIELILLDWLREHPASAEDED